MFIDKTKLGNSVAWRLLTQLAVVLLCALMLKQSYATSSPNELGWILTPTSFLVQIVTGISFTFESHAGYITGDRSFVIAGACAGVNFLITAFLMLALSRLWRTRSEKISWRFIPLTLVFAYLATLIANTARISTALYLRQMPFEVGGLNSNQLHRFEGILIYFGFLLLLYTMSERFSGMKASSQDPRTPKNTGVSKTPVSNVIRLLRQSLFPLAIYYATTLGIPLANAAYGYGSNRHRAYGQGAFSQGADFWQHSLFVLLTPLLLILAFALIRLFNLRNHSTPWSAPAWRRFGLTIITKHSLSAQGAKPTSRGWMGLS